MAQFIDSNFSYDAWIGEQAEKIRSAVNRLAMAGRYDGVVFCFPSKGATAGFLTVETDYPKETGWEIIRFPGVGDRVSSVPFSHLTTQLWHACRCVPIVPVITR